MGALIAGLAVLTACTTGSSEPSQPTHAGALAMFAKAFDDESGHRRLVLLMSPT